MEEEMYVIKRNGEREPVKFEQITERIQNLCDGLNHVDAATITYKTVRGMSSRMTTIQLDELASQIAAAMTTRHPEYGLLAGRIAVSNLHKQTKESFSEVIRDLYEAVNARTGKRAPAVSEHVFNIVQANAERLNAAINFKADFDFSYFGILTLQRSYLLKVNNKIVERPQHMLMRVALGIHGEDIDAAIETYRLMSERWFTHATPTLFNSGTTIPQMSSCFLLQMTEDSIDGIFKTLHRCAMISKTAGGIGLSVHNIRAAGSYISGTNGISSGLIPMLQVFNSTARYVDQGGNKRPGAVAIYLEPWHSDVFDFLDLRKNTGPDYIRARDLFLALWVPDLFMERVNEDGEWSLMCPDECPGLSDVYGDEFVKLYTKYEAEGKYKKKIQARNLWFHIIDAQIETGTPYMLYKDACNRKSNQQHLGTIKSSNLCTEIIQFTSPDEVAVCNLASIALNRFVDKETRTFDFEQLKYVTSIITKNLNKVIDVNYYPIPEARNSNMRHRPIGIGVQGLADAFILMRYPFDGPDARKLNKQIFETIYYAACKTSCELAQEHGPYETFQGSPASKGQLQYDLWGLDQKTLMYKEEWVQLKSMIAQYGMRNSLLVAPMPTASTAQILGNNESIEPYTSNMYVRRVLSGEFQVVNQHLIEDLVKLGLWNEDVRYQIMRDYGSVQAVAEIPDDIKALYKNVWEIPQKSIIDMAADRAPFVDQSQSMNIHFAKPKRSTITSMHFHGWRAGLKTGMYYLRTKPAANPIQFTLDETKLKSYKLQKEKKKAKENGSETPSTSMPDDEASSIGIGGDATNRLSEIEACSLANGPDCQMCSG